MEIFDLINNGENLHLLEKEYDCNGNTKRQLFTGNALNINSFLEDVIAMMPKKEAAKDEIVPKCEGDMGCPNDSSGVEKNEI